MDQVIERVTHVVQEMDTDPISKITEILQSLTSAQKNVTWMAQPLEQAVYVHTDTKSQFDVIKDELDLAITKLNTTLQTTGKVGKYYCNPDLDRHCIDLYYSRF